MNEKNYSSELYQELLLNEGLFDKIKSSLGIKGKKLSGDNLNKLETNITQLLSNIAKELGAVDNVDLIKNIEKYKTDGIITDEIGKYIQDLNNLLTSIKTNKSKYGGEPSTTSDPKYAAANKEVDAIFKIFKDKFDKTLVAKKAPVATR